MSIMDIIRKRKSIRKFKQKPLLKETIQELIYAAVEAPSAGNLQPWKFIIVMEKETKDKLVVAALGQRFIAEAPVVIVVCAEPFISSRYYGERGAKLYCIQDTAAAIENMLLFASSKNLGACWVGAFNEKEVSRILNIPNTLIPVALVPVGYPAEDPQKPSRKPIESVIYYEKF
ncbi:MAG: nitroreductase family protein [Candidatus Odinarchaeia archaeon]